MWARTRASAPLLACVVVCVLASVVRWADGRATRRRQDGGRGEQAQFKLDLEHQEEDWRAKYLGASARLENNECGRPDELDEEVANDEGLWAPPSLPILAAQSFRLIQVILSTGAVSYVLLFNVASMHIAAGDNWVQSPVLNITGEWAQWSSLANLPRVEWLESHISKLESHTVS